ncbi:MULTISPECIES: RcpC/CpaB family pilus assembly protein [Arthrobacter]|uniref:RcpC/CpaB family pilus assembly protein n=2 Tax=Arthrobacter TaxID=1663 RepID=A0ABU9KFU7_9MICC|nr:RcpC/CpaB family pilus assembly protein [Arthrobacter sp. YJM1]MDP5225761.1 RcpC/CpaB family pilus assembly protein [Arthrobacter sp. YJM1]
MRTRLIGGLAALVVAVIGTVLLIMYVNGADKRALNGTESTEVYVVQKQVLKGTIAGNLGDAVAKKPVPKSVVPQDAVSNLADLGTTAASSDLEPGEVLIKSRFVNANDLNGPRRVSIPAGMQEITLKLPIERVVGGTLSAGDTVGVIISLNADNNTPNQTQQTFNKVLVTGVQLVSGENAPNNADDQSTQKSSGGIGSSGSSSNGNYLVTIARTPADSDRIIYAVEYGKVYLSKEPGTTTENSGAPIDRGRVFR